MTENTMPADRIDPAATIPSAVKAASARADELHRKMLQGEQPPADEAPAPAPEEPEVKAKAENFSSEPPTKAPVTTDDAWEHKYNSMKGRYEREQQERNRLVQEISNYQRLLSEMQATAPAQAASSDVRFQRLVTPEEEQDYGSEFLGVVGKKAKEELTPEIAQLKAHIQALESRLSGVTNAVVQDTREKMYQQLDAQVPNWRELNSNSEFLSWLNLPDAYSGAIRKELLTAAYNRSDANRVAAFFKGFIADEAATNPASYSQPDQVAPRGNKVSLETLAAPGRAKTAAATAPAEKPIFTRAQITEFYSDVRRGKYAGKDGEKDRIEKDIFAAQREGRIR